MLETSIWAILSSSPAAASRCGGHVTNAPVDIHMNGWPLLRKGSTCITGAHFAPIGSSATTTPCLSRLRLRQHSGTRTKIILAQIRSWQAAIQGGTGAAQSVAILGKHRLLDVSVITVGALSVLEKTKITRSSQP